MAEGFSGKGGLVDTEGDGIEELAVGGYLVTGIDDDDITPDYISARYGRGASVSDYLYRLVVIDLIEYPECLVGPIFKRKDRPVASRMATKMPTGSKNTFQP